MKKQLFNFIKIIFSIANISLWFVPLFKSVGYLPSEIGDNIHRVEFWHTAYENIGDLLHPIVAYISIFISVASIVLSVIAIIFSKNKKVNFISNVVFIISITLFIVLLIVASSVGRGY